MKAVDLNGVFGMRWAAIVVLALCVVLMGCEGGGGDDSSNALVGTWSLTMSNTLGGGAFEMTFGSDGTLVAEDNLGPDTGPGTGTYSITGNMFTATVMMPYPATIVFEGTVDGDAMSGAIAQPQGGTGASFTGTRQ